MGLIDVMVNRAFRETQAGRVVVFSGDPRKRSYLVRSPAEEQKIRSFLKMFYFAHLYILVFGVMLSQVCALWLAHGSFDRPAHHLLGGVSIFVAIYCLVVGLPYALLWRAYKRALTSFVALALEQVVIDLCSIDAGGCAAASSMRSEIVRASGCASLRYTSARSHSRIPFDRTRDSQTRRRFTRCSISD